MTVTSNSLPLMAYMSASISKKLSNTDLIDQFICSLKRDSLQIEILAKTSLLTSFENVVKNAATFEAAQRDHVHLQSQSDTTACLSEHKQH